MKICFTSKGCDLESEVEARFGRAPYFVIYDDESGAHEVAENIRNLEAASGAGVQSASTLVGKDCSWIVTGHIGPKAMSVLKAAGVKVVTGVTGPIREAIEAFTAGQLKETDQADVPSHW